MLKCNLVLILILSGCMAHVMPPVSQKTLWLNKSYYGGIFYDDDRFRLLSDISFEKLTYLKSPTGDVILPPESDEVVPYGTRVQVLKIEWPTHENIFKRPLLTPRHYPWIYLKVAMDRGSVTLMRDKTYIVIVPDVVETEAKLGEWMAKHFDSQDNNLLFLQKNTSERAAILTPAK